MPERMFVDTPAIIAAVYHAHEFAGDAQLLWKAIAVQESEWHLVTSDYCLAEAYSYLRGISAAHAVLAGEMQRIGILNRIPITEWDWTRAWSHARNKRWERLTFHDALHFAVLEREDIRTVFTSNRLYARAGFRVFTGGTKRI